MRRHKMSGHASRRSFTRGASRSHYRNLMPSSPMRGGYRL